MFVFKTFTEKTHTSCDIMHDILRLVLAHMKKCLPFKLDLNQFTYRSNGALHSVLTHLDRNNTYARMLLTDFGSAFNPN